MIRDFEQRPLFELAEDVCCTHSCNFCDLICGIIKGIGTKVLGITTRPRNRTDVLDNRMKFTRFVQRQCVYADSLLARRITRQTIFLPNQLRQNAINCPAFGALVGTPSHNVTKFEKLQRQLS
jgi:hypothetical protein